MFCVTCVHVVAEATIHMSAARGRWLERQHPEDESADGCDLNYKAGAPRSGWRRRHFDSRPNDYFRPLLISFAFGALVGAAR